MKYYCVRSYPCFVHFDISKVDNVRKQSNCDATAMAVLEFKDYMSPMGAVMVI